MAHSIRRRQVLAAGGAAAIVGLLAGSVVLSRASKETKKVLNEALPEITANDPLDFEVFLALSRLVTGWADLDRDVAALHYEVFSEEPWAAKHVNDLYALLLDKLQGTAAADSALALLQKGDLDGANDWFARHLLTTWYLGIYYHERQTTRVTYEGALMWRVVEDVAPIPGMSDLEYGYWLNPPEGAV